MTITAIDGYEAPVLEGTFHIFWGKPTADDTPTKVVVTRTGTDRFKLTAYQMVAGEEIRMGWAERNVVGDECLLDFMRHLRDGIRCQMTAGLDSGYYVEFAEDPDCDLGTGKTPDLIVWRNPNYLS